MIVNLRGPSGSGKSYPGFKLLEEYGPGIEIRSRCYFAKKGKPLRNPKLIGHLLPGGLVLAGRYRIKKSTRVEGKGYTGGLDGWFPIDELQRMLEHIYDLWPHGFMESLMVSGTTPRWADFAKAHQPFAFATLDTPIEKCIERVMARNGGKAVKEDQMTAHRRAVVRSARKLAELGCDSRRIDHRCSYEQVRDLLLEGGWDPSDGFDNTEGDGGTIEIEAPLMTDLPSSK